MIIIAQLYIPIIQSFIGGFRIFLLDFLFLEVKLVFFAHLILNRWIVILPIKFNMTFHVMDSQIDEYLRNPIYIFLLCTLVPFLSRNNSISQFYYLVHMTNNTNPNIKQILTTNNHYIVLGIDRDSSDRQIKKAYREMALLYHPDKNSIPQAKEIFNKVVHAYNVLSNQDMRNSHDQIIDKKQKKSYYQSMYHPFQPFINKKQTQFKSEYSQPLNQNHFQKNKSPKSEQSQPVQQNLKGAKKRPHYQQKSEKKGKYRGSFKENRSNSLAYFLLIVFFTISFFFSQKKTQPAFLFSPNDNFTLKMKTKVLKVNYYLKPDYDQKLNPISEELVQKLYVRTLEKQCLNSLNAKKMYEKLAQKTIAASQKSVFVTYAQNINLKSCKRIVKLLRKYPNLKLETFDNNIVGF